MDAERLDWLRQVVTWSGSFLELLESQNPNLWFGKNAPVFCGDKKLLQRVVVITKNTKPKTKNWKPLKSRVVRPSLVTYKNAGIIGSEGCWTCKASERPDDAETILATGCEEILEPEHSVDLKRYALTPKMLIYSLREAIQRRGGYLYLRSLKREATKREMWEWLKVLAPQDVNEISPGIYRLRSRPGSKAWHEAKQIRMTGAA
jgi:hypothetical protein